MTRRITTLGIALGGILVVAWAVSTRNLVMVLPGVLLVGAGVLLFSPGQTE